MEDGALRTRACDRCASLKTQCDLKDRCARCERLGLVCEDLRHKAPRGRPRKQAVRVAVVRDDLSCSPRGLQTDSLATTPQVL